jgi:hypothetical protein
MTFVAEEPPQDPDDWSEEQWREWLANAPPDPETGKAHPLTRLASTPTGAALGAAMLGLDQAIFGERPKAEIIAEAADPGEGLDDPIDLDGDDPSASTIELAPEE